MPVLALAMPHPDLARESRDCGCSAWITRPQRRRASFKTGFASGLAAGPGSGKRHFPEEFSQGRDTGYQHFEMRSTAEVYDAFPAMVRASTPLTLSPDAALEAPSGVELQSMELGPMSGRRTRPSVSSSEWEPHWLDAPRRRPNQPPLPLE